MAGLPNPLGPAGNSGTHWSATGGGAYPLPSEATQTTGQAYGDSVHLHGGAPQDLSSYGYIEMEQFAGGAIHGSFADANMLHFGGGGQDPDPQDDLGAIQYPGDAHQSVHMGANASSFGGGAPSVSNQGYGGYQMSPHLSGGDQSGLGGAHPTHYRDEFAYGGDYGNDFAYGAEYGGSNQLQYPRNQMVSAGEEVSQATRGATKRFIDFVSLPENGGKTREQLHADIIEFALRPENGKKSSLQIRAEFLVPYPPEVYPSPRYFEYVITQFNNEERAQAARQSGYTARHIGPMHESKRKAAPEEIGADNARSRPMTRQEGRQQRRTAKLDRELQALSQRPTEQPIPISRHPPASSGSADPTNWY